MFLVIYLRKNCCFFISKKFLDNAIDFLPNIILMLKDNNQKNLIRHDWQEIHVLKTNESVVKNN